MDVHLDNFGYLGTRLWHMSGKFLIILFVVYIANQPFYIFFCAHWRLIATLLHGWKFSVYRQISLDWKNVFSYQSYTFNSLIFSENSVNQYTEDFQPCYSYIYYCLYAWVMVTRNRENHISNLLTFLFLWYLLYLWDQCYKSMLSLLFENQEHYSYLIKSHYVQGCL